MKSRMFLACAFAVAVGSASVVHIATPVIAQALQPACLHGSDETPVEAGRRRAALVFARQVNTAEANQRRGQRLAPLADLTGIPAAPDGFKAQLSTDGLTYTFSVKDALDSCHFAYFSDQDGLIYSAAAIR